MCCISGVSYLISDHVYDSVSAYFYVIDGKYLRGFSASEFDRTLPPCHVWEFSNTILAHLAIQANSARCYLAKKDVQIPYLILLTIINEALPCSVNAVI